jgi:outer membrane protein OmpA-like peptidoglycan-associated protein
VYWDAARGRPDSYTEEFEFIFDLSSKDTVENRGKAEARVIESSVMDKDLIAEAIAKDLREYGVRDTEVKIDPLGVTLTLDNIQFPPDSSLLVPTEKEKLDRIGTILSKYADRDILITGHTALAGTAEGRQKLSEDRAAAVGEYLLRKNIRSKDRMSYRGLGAEVPVAENTSESGRAKNRRVEITILEN